MRAEKAPGLIRSASLTPADALHVAALHSYSEMNRSRLVSFRNYNGSRAKWQPCCRGNSKRLWDRGSSGSYATSSMGQGTVSNN
ncbi:MAG: hypothetical protein WBF36_01845 [Desulfobulbales bacterium]